MAPSQEYLELLDELQHSFIAASGAADRAARWILDDWRQIRQSQEPRYLLTLAESALVFLYASKNTSITSIIDDMRSLHIRKNAGYTGDNADPWWNFRQCEVFGITAVQGVLTRLSDKISRFQMLRQNASNEQVNESIEDTVVDIAAYSLIAVCLLRENK